VERGLRFFYQHCVPKGTLSSLVSGFTNIASLKGLDELGSFTKISSLKGLGGVWSEVLPRFRP
jgi:hypothetical protein